MSRFLDTHDTTVVYHPYRTARVVPQVVALDRSENHQLEQDLAVKAGVRPDNHVVYECRPKAGSPIYIWATDSSLYIGTTIIREEW